MADFLVNRDRRLIFVRNELVGGGGGGDGELLFLNHNFKALPTKVPKLEDSTFVNAFSRQSSK